jgi:hypothetical protein
VFYLLKIELNRFIKKKISMRLKALIFFLLFFGDFIGKKSSIKEKNIIMGFSTPTKILQILT